MLHEFSRKDKCEGGGQDCEVKEEEEEEGGQNELLLQRSERPTPNERVNTHGTAYQNYRPLVDCGLHSVDMTVVA